MLAEIFVVLGVIFLLSLLGYLIPQLIVCFSKPLDLKTRYGGGYAFITGGNSGIGEQFAYKVAKMGFNVAILGQNEDRLNKTAKSISEINPEVRVKTIVADLSGDPQKVVDDVVSKLRGEDVSILFFNAGYGVMELASNPSEATLRQFRSNIVTHQYLFQELYPKLAARKTSSNRRGGVLFTASVGAFIYPPVMAVYGATKVYLGHLGECLATEAEYYGVDVVSLYPGGTATRFSERIKNVTMPKGIEKASQSSERVAGLALSGLGRITRVDCGIQGIGARIVLKLIDANIFTRIMQKALPGLMKGFGFAASNETENKNE